jgi:hypothetical protein
MVNFKIRTLEMILRKSIYDLDISIKSISRGTGIPTDINRLYHAYEYCADGLTTEEHEHKDIYKDLLSIKRVIDLIVERLKLCRTWLHPYITPDQSEILYLLLYRYEIKVLSCLS